MRHIVLALALGLLAGSALADLSPPTCGAGGMGGGWTPVTGDDVPKEVVDAVVNTVIDSVASNLTQLLPVTGDTLTLDSVSVAGCQQVVQGTNYKLWINLTATADTNNVTLGLTADVFNPLPANNGGAGQKLTVYDIDLEFVTVDGIMIAQDLDGDNDDKWEVDDNGVIIANGNWTNAWTTGTLLDDVSDLFDEDYEEDDGPGMDLDDMKDD